VNITISTAIKPTAIKFQNGEIFSLADGIAEIVKYETSECREGRRELFIGATSGQCTLIMEDGTELDYFIRYRRFNMIKGKPWTVSISQSYGPGGITVNG
jgi:hypothetical protein